MDSIGIGTLAKRAGVGIDTVRHYERNGLLSPTARLPVHEGLSTLIAACPGHGRAADCPILKALGGQETHDRGR